MKFLPLLLISLSAHSIASEHELLQNFLKCDDSFSQYLAKNPDAAHGAKLVTKGDLAAFELEAPYDAAKDLGELGEGVSEIVRRVGFTPELPLTGTISGLIYTEQHFKSKKSPYVQNGKEESYAWRFSSNNSKEEILEQLNKIKAAPNWTCDSNGDCAEYRQFKKGKWVTTPSKKVDGGKPYLKIALEGSAHMYAKSDLECKLVVLGSFLPPNMINSLHSNWQ